MSSTKNDADSSNTKNGKPFLLKFLEVTDFGNFVSNLIVIGIAGYTVSTIMDKYYSHRPGIEEEKERLKNEKELEKYRALGWAEGLWTYIFPKKESQE